MTYDLSTVAAQIIVVNDRVISGERPDKAGPAARARLGESGLSSVGLVVVGEDAGQVRAALATALQGRARLVLVLGGTGFSRHDRVPEEVREVIEVELPGIAEQIRAHGLASTALSSLSREVVGVTSRDEHGALVVASPGSRGGASDTLDVIVPLLPHVLAQLDEE